MVVIEPPNIWCSEVVSFELQAAKANVVARAAVAARVFRVRVTGASFVVGAGKNRRSAPRRRSCGQRYVRPAGPCFERRFARFRPDSGFLKVR
jgi:hypothetical protein